MIVAYICLDVPRQCIGIPNHCFQWQRCASRFLRTHARRCLSGMASSPLRTPQFYSASYTEDLRNVIDRLHDRYPKTQLFAMGWSLGANILVNYLGEEGKDSKISAAVSLCNPFDLSQCDTNWQSGFSQIYNWNLASAMKDNFRSHMHLFEGYDVERAMSASTVREVDDAITCVTFGKRYSQRVSTRFTYAFSFVRLGECGCLLSWIRQYPSHQ